MLKYKLLYCSILILIFNLYSAKSTDYLQECVNKQLASLKGKYLLLNYTSERHNLYSSMEPWQSYPASSFGAAVFTPQKMFQLDTVKRGEKILVNKTQYDGQSLLIMNYWDTTLAKVSYDDLQYQPIENANISPTNLLDIFTGKGVKPDKESDNSYAVYKTDLNKNIVKLYINKSDFLIDKIAFIKYNDFYGDEPVELNFEEYKSTAGIYYPSKIFINKVNGKTRDTTIITGAETIGNFADILSKPGDYKITDESKKDIKISVEKYNDRLTFLDLTNDDTRVLLVEFDDYCMVIDSPLNSENGEAIINKVKELLPGKPIKYFTYGHRCPWAAGGFRPFVAKGITMLCNTEQDKDFIAYLGNAPRTLDPDALQKNHKPIDWKMIKDSITISDGNYEVKAYVIGKLSAHTNDFMIYYFPKEKIIWQDHLAWIKKDEPITKAGARQAGLYKAIKDLNLNVDTIVQSWPLEQYGVKTIFPFSDLEESMSVK